MAQAPQIADIQRIVADLGKQYGAGRIFLFGSFARGDAAADSDIDLRIDKGKIRGLFALSGLHFAREERLGRKVDLLRDHPEKCVNFHRGCRIEAPQWR